MIFHRSGLIPGVYLFVVTVYGAFLQIVNKKAALSAPICKNAPTLDYPRHDYLRWEVLSAPRWGEYHRFLLLVAMLAWRDWDGVGSENLGTARKLSAYCDP